jgi:hypothetical protein
VWQQPLLNQHHRIVRGIKCYGAEMARLPAEIDNHGKEEDGRET